MALLDSQTDRRTAKGGEVGMSVLLILLVGVCMICLMCIAADIEKIRKLVEREWQD